MSDVVDVGRRDGGGVAFGQVFEPAALGEEPQCEPDLGDEGRGQDDGRCRAVVAGDEEEAEGVDEVAGTGEDEEHAERAWHLPR